ncbi:hypothetical protein NLI96_g8806 [Meripilus lineatus]|uniref:MFS general substrate transporter n=1 Tax=Meripilus lineatus TaxID=2056292 RepID=A0AAD5YBN6_9APHY|nr:hypothetical protein NLI96_g8806 [Physisporinus lineatus]
MRTSLSLINPPIIEAKLVERPQTIVAELVVQAPSVPEEFVEGGAKAWLTILGGWFSLFATFGYANAFGVYQDYYTRSGSASASSISWIGSTQLFFLLGTAFPAGKLFDMGYCRQLIFCGGLLYIVSLFMVSLADTSKYYQIFLAQGVGTGLGAGLMYLPSVAIQSQYWRQKRPMAMGIVMSGSSVGGIVYPIMFNNLLHGRADFAWATRATAFLNLGIVVLANILMIPRPPKTKPENKTPISKVLMDPPYVLFLASAILVSLGLLFPIFYLQLYSILHGVDSKLAFYTISILNAASIFGRILPSLLAQRIGLLNTHIPITFITGALVFATYGANTAAGAVALAVFYGFFSGSCTSERRETQFGVSSQS